VNRTKIADADQLAEGQTVKFPFTRGARPAEGFLARFKGELVAYENKCRHLPVSLDYPGDRFFSTDAQHFVCQNHNALYDPLTGLCVRGPCEGESLKRLKIEVVHGEIWLIHPE
jgi:nitrite reductase/ring-hydroxylating ferredoxin subunit